MMKRRKEHAGKNTLSAMTVGFVFMMLFELIICLATSVLIFHEKIDTSNMTFVGASSCLLASSIAAYIAGKYNGRQYAVACFGAVACYLIFLALCTVLLFRGRFSGVGLRMGTGVVGAVIACALCMIQSKKKKRPKKRKL